MPRKNVDGSISPGDLIEKRTFGEKWQHLLQRATALSGFFGQWLFGLLFTFGKPFKNISADNM